MALVAFDCLLPSTWFTVRGHRVGWPRGALTGVAGALKLTPMIFLLYFVARRDWRGCANLVGGFLAATAIGFALCPGDSRMYWTKTVFDTSRIGLPIFSGNQSITGVLFRAHLTGGAENKVWLVLCVLVGLAALTAITKAARRGRLVTALALNAGTELLVSPVSWSHHWVWVAPVLVCALIKGWRMRRDGNSAGYFWRAAAVTAVFLAEPQVWFPHTNDLEQGWALWEQVIGSAYVWVALVTLLFYAFRPQPPVVLSGTGSRTATAAATEATGATEATTAEAEADGLRTAELLAADEEQRAHAGGPYGR
jgi:alpha-1,2-mannosyltransferase